MRRRLREVAFILTAPGYQVAPSAAGADQLTVAGAFQGQWHTVTSLYGRLLLTLVPFELPDGTIVSGRFGNRDRDYNGTLQGSLSADGEHVLFSRKQPRLGMVGNGRFALSPDGSSVAGHAIVRGIDLASMRMEWNGTRK